MPDAMSFGWKPREERPMTTIGEQQFQQAVPYQLNRCANALEGILAILRGQHTAFEAIDERFEALGDSEKQAVLRLINTLTTEPSPT